MSTISIKNVSNRLFELLNQAAATHHRSINSELFQLIGKVKIGGKLNPEQHLAAARQSRAITKGFLLAPDFLQKATKEGCSK